MKCEAIRAHSSEHSVRKMCKVLELCESSYYQWLRGEKKRQKRKEAERGLTEEVRKEFEESGRIYGFRKLREALAGRKEPIELSEWKVRRIMRENGLYPEILKKYRPGRKGKTDGRGYENVLNRDFRSEGPNQKLVGDITYLKTRLGWVYLATVMDLYNREIIGYAVSRTIDTELVCRALGNAL